MLMLLSILFALLSVSQAVLPCISGTNSDDLTKLFLNISGDSNIDAETTIPPYRASATVAASASAYQEKLDADLTVDINVAITDDQLRAKFREQFGIIVGEYPSDALTRAAQQLCFQVKAAAALTLLLTTNAVVDNLLGSVWQSYQAWQTALNQNAAALRLKVEANAGAVEIFQATLAIEIAQATERAAEIGFYVAIVENRWRTEFSNLINCTVQYFVAVDSGSSTAALTEIQTTCENTYLAFHHAYAVMVRAYRWREDLAAEVEARRERLQAALQELEDNIRAAWDDIRAKVAAWWAQNEEEVRRRIAEFLENVRCDVGSATVSFSSNDGEKTFSATVNGLVCYDTRTEAEIFASVCANLKARLVTEVGTTDVSAYKCVAVKANVAAKRALGQSGTGVDVTIDGSDPGQAPGTPTPVAAPNSGASVVCCFLLLLISVLFHF